jgi:hypothetical protein
LACTGFGRKDVIHPRPPVNRYPKPEQERRYLKTRMGMISAKRIPQ